MTGVRFPVFGTTAHLLVTDPGALAAAEAELRVFLSEVDSACSRFRPDSTLSTLNASGAARVDPILFTVVRVALDAAEVTDGLVDPTLGNAMIAIGYDRTFADLAPVSTPVTPVRGGGWRGIGTDAATRTIQLPLGVRLDLGATAKAWAADVAARRVAASTGAGVLVNLGGDLAIAGPPRDWKVRVADDHRATDGGQVVTVRSGGVATSSTTVRTWRRADQVLHHVLDPATGLPARRVWRSVSVAARTCVQANTAATAAIVLGTAAPDWLAANDIPARLVGTDHQVTRVAGWPTDLQEAA
ncbi:Thiamin biosynthesis lipoprotein ApbE [Alloactinosynnema sp. L-07]|uniref:FAD:protein FMN transferase n=1 Tax=Alloactinosynnema sp. L-07 TaxID=1653480 RepID=UPI00065EF75C|nr:FAD:protein FMN transferase [Alloactinosynnema sp. L-07]CRK60740.1 Thiamin biosynthesis lipoprotein ApbE [Alloactinosynnema sp. L-07]